MKKLLFFLLVFFAAINSYAAQTLICTSFEKIYGWTGVNTYEKLIFTAYVKSDTELTAAELRGAYISDSRDIKADSNYKPHNPKYKDHNRFDLLEDAWNWFYPLIPKNFTSVGTTKFKGYIQISDEEGWKETVGMSCFVKE